MSSDSKTLSELRQLRDSSLKVGFISSAKQYNAEIEERTGESENVDSNAAAALSADADPRLHAPLEDPDEVRERFEKAERHDFAALAEAYSERHEELTGEALADPEPEPSEAALEEQTRAALAEPDGELLDRTEAALGADDVVEAAERGQSPPQYVFDAYGRDPRDFDDEYELRAALRDAEPKRLPQQEEEISTARAALSVADRADLDTGGQTPAGLIRSRYGLEPNDYEDAEELRAAIVAQGGYKSDVSNTPESRFSALSANRKNGDSADD